MKEHASWVQTKNVKTRIFLYKKPAKFGFRRPQWSSTFIVWITSLEKGVTMEGLTMFLADRNSRKISLVDGFAVGSVGIDGRWLSKDSFVANRNQGITDSWRKHAKETNPEGYEAAVEMSFNQVNEAIRGRYKDPLWNGICLLLVSAVASVPNCIYHSSDQSCTCFRDCMLIESSFGVSKYRRQSSKVARRFHCFLPSFPFDTLLGCSWFLRDVQSNARVRYSAMSLASVSVFLCEVYVGVQVRCVLWVVAGVGF